MIQFKNSDEIEKLRLAGKVSKKILESALQMCDEGISTLEIDKFINSEIDKAGAVPWFKEEKDYSFASCISVNEVWIHGIPNDKKLAYGDIVSIDLGVKLDGYYVDHCWTVPVVKPEFRPKDIFSHFSHDSIDPKIRTFLKTGQIALSQSIAKFRNGGRTGDISAVMQDITEGAGYSVVKEYTGHGVGLSGHEDPTVSCYGTKGAGALLRRGMVLAIEIMYSMGSPETAVKEDGWSVYAKDESLTAMFEHTVALTEKGAEILTI